MKNMQDVVKQHIKLSIYNIMLTFQINELVPIGYELIFIKFQEDKYFKKTNITIYEITLNKSS